MHTRGMETYTCRINNNNNNSNTIQCWTKWNAFEGEWKKKNNNNTRILYYTENNSTASNASSIVGCVVHQKFIYRKLNELESVSELKRMQCHAHWTLGFEEQRPKRTTMNRRGKHVLLMLMFLLVQQPLHTQYINQFLVDISFRLSFFRVLFFSQHGIHAFSFCQ